MKKRHFIRMLCMVLIASLLFSSVEIRPFAADFIFDQTEEKTELQDESWDESYVQTEDVIQTEDATKYKYNVNTSNKICDMLQFSDLQITVEEVSTTCSLKVRNIDSVEKISEWYLLYLLDENNNIVGISLMRTCDLVPKESANLLTNTDGNFIDVKDYEVRKENHKYKLTLDAQSPTESGTAEVEVGYKAALPEITIPQKNGFVFKGYYENTMGNGKKYYDENGMGCCNFETIFDVTLYAYWESEDPGMEPSNGPSINPSISASVVPSEEPSASPSVSASAVPSTGPSAVPSEVPSTEPSVVPSEIPSTAPSEEPSELPDILPSIAPEVDVTVSISMNDIENKEKEELNKIAEEAVTQTVENSIPEGLDYNGGMQTVDLNLTIDGVQLAEGTDYVIKYKNAVNAGGEARMEIKFLGDYKKLGTVTKEFTINAVDIAGDDFAAADLYYVAGKSVKPAPVLYYKGKKLKVGKDFTFENEIITEDTTLTLTGCGNFTGTRDINVIFIDKEEETRTSLSKAKISISKTLIFEGSLVEPEGEDFVVSIGSGKNKVILERDVDYIVEFSGNDRRGTAVAVIRSLPGSEYCYGDKTVTFKIAGAKISKAKISLELTDETGVIQMLGTKKGTEAAYTGSTICPSVKAGINNPDGSTTVLREGIDYTLSYKKNRKKGTATVTVTGIGAYTGTKTVKFKIK